MAKARSRQFCLSFLVSVEEPTSIRRSQKSVLQLFEGGTMQKAKFAPLISLLPIAAVGSGAGGFLQRVPALPGTVDETVSGLQRLEAQGATPAT